MNVILIGKRKIKFEDEKGVTTEGVQIYYISHDELVTGYYSDRLWIGKGNPLYEKALKIDLEYPKTAILVWNYTGLSKKARLSDIDVINDAEISG